MPNHRQYLAILMSVGTRAFADVGLNLFYIQIFGERGLGSLYILIVGELIIFPVHLVRKGGKVIAEHSYRLSTTGCGKDIA